MPLSRRLLGVLLHPTSLPGPFGIGDLGPEAVRFIDWMASAGIGLWQVLPLGPTGFGDSPYQCFSAFAGNPYLISPELLARDGYLAPEELKEALLPHAAKQVDYGPAIERKVALLRKAHARFTAHRSPASAKAYAEFQKRDVVAGWLDDFALFMAIKAKHNGEGWNTWAAPLRTHDKKAIDATRKELALEIDFHKFCQFVFFTQWDALRARCHERGIRIVGDAPIYVAYDSADTWAHQDLFELDKNGMPTAVAGVPPDYFSKTGQLWGNPLYDWAAMKKKKYAWWIERMRTLLATVDVVRLDHFRGFMGYWSVPFGAPTAEKGTWVKGPAADFFNALQKGLGSLDIIAEDLGDITTDVTAVRQQFDLPGMKIMQFAWSPKSVEPLYLDASSGFAPHQIEENTVAYTGTHDNDTTKAWWDTLGAKEKHAFRTYLATDGNLAHWDLIRAGMMSMARTFIVPMQDFLGVGAEGRMNLPGRAAGNWGWRMNDGDASAKLADHLSRMALLYGRHANPPKDALAEPQKEPTYA